MTRRNAISTAMLPSSRGAAVRASSMGFDGDTGMGKPSQTSKLLGHGPCQQRMVAGKPVCRAGWHDRPYFALENFLPTGEGAPH